MEWIGLVWFIGYAPIAAALIIALFWTVLSHPDRIRNPFEFRLSALCLGASIVASVLIPLALLIHFSNEARGDRRTGLGTMLYLCAIPPILTMLALLLGLDSVMAKRAQPEAIPAPVGEQQPNGPR